MSSYRLEEHLEKVKEKRAYKSASRPCVYLLKAPKSRGEPEYHTEVRGGEERKDRQSIASPRLAFFFFPIVIVIIVFFGLPPNSFRRHIGRVSTAATSIIAAIAVAVAVAIVVVAIIETARVIPSVVIIAAVVVVIKAVIFVLIVVVCFCKVRRGMGSMGGKRSNRRDSRRRDAIMPTRNAARRCRSRTTRGYGGHVRGLPELSPWLDLDMPESKLRLDDPSLSAQLGRTRHQDWEGQRRKIERGGDKRLSPLRAGVERKEEGKQEKEEKEAKEEGSREQDGQGSCCFYCL